MLFGWLGSFLFLNMGWVRPGLFMVLNFCYRFGYLLGRCEDDSGNTCSRSRDCAFDYRYPFKALVRVTIRFVLFIS